MPSDKHLSDDEFEEEMRRSIAERGGIEVVLGLRPHPADVVFKESVLHDGPTALPPCLQEVAQALATGGNPGHMARFSLAAFLLKRDVPEEEIVDFFRGAANFREATTRSQLASIASRGYAPHTCSKLRAAGLCRENDVCAERGCVTPLSFPRSVGA